MTAWLGDTLIATTVLMALVLVVRGPVRRCFGAAAAYALWLVPALRLVLPPLDLFPAVPVVTTGKTIQIALAASDAPPATASWLALIWAAGAVAFWAWHIVAYRLFMQRALASTPPVPTGRAPVVSTDQVAGPAAAGLLKPVILVPWDFDFRFSPAERRLALCHEQVHLQRGDLWANAVALVVLGLHWFNPVAHCAYRAFREDQELSCDAAVIAGAAQGERAAYAAAMVKSAWGTAPSTLCPMTRTTNLKRRLKMVRTHHKSALASTGGTLAVGLLALGGLALTATGSIAAEPAAKGTTVIVKRLQGSASSGAAKAEIDARCGSASAQSLTETLSQQMGKPVKVQLVNCRGANQSPAERAAAMEKARAGVASSGAMSDAERSKVLAAMDEAIAKLKAQQ